MRYSVSSTTLRAKRRMKPLNYDVEIRVFETAARDQFP
jgi:hypothetical protein